MQFRKYLAECIGCFALVFIGCGAILVDAQFGILSHAGISASFALIIMVMVYTFAPISGGHFNPAVTVGAWAARRISATQLLGYIVAQLIGALLASYLLLLIFPEHIDAIRTVPSSLAIAFPTEVIISFFLVLVILFVTDKNAGSKSAYGLAIGGTIMGNSLFAGPLSGASMNPARSLGPALILGNFSALWLYLTAPIVGAVLAVAAYRIILKKPHVHS